MSDETVISCGGSYEWSDRVHPSGAVVCPICNGAYPSAGFVVPLHGTPRVHKTDDIDRNVDDGEIDPFEISKAITDPGHW